MRTCNLTFDPPFGPREILYYRIGFWNHAFPSTLFPQISATTATQKMSGDGSEIKSTTYYQTPSSDHFAATLTLAFMQTIAIGARLAARKLSATNLWWDDDIIVLALGREDHLPLGAFETQCLCSQSITGPRLWAVHLLLDSTLSRYATLDGILRYMVAQAQKDGLLIFFKVSPNRLCRVTSRHCV